MRANQCLPRKHIVKEKIYIIIPRLFSHDSHNERALYGFLSKDVLSELATSLWMVSVYQ